MQEILDDDDNDSALGFVSRESSSHRQCIEKGLTVKEIQTDAESDSTSLASSIARYRLENGRTYHAYKEGCELFKFCGVSEA
jgi:hypothetical protein